MFNIKKKMSKLYLDSFIVCELHLIITLERKTIVNCAQY